MLPTRDHDAIRLWAARTYATPAEIHIRKFDGQPAVLHFIIGEPQEQMTDIIPISWASFFAQFDLLDLAFAWDENSTRFTIVKIDKPNAVEQRH